ncbi:hypothetical protein [uncultured Enorma sp.]|uniref:hypothetical protein n=1 Tax=uncultured Enorma sp. TaxID=1714346 RepID=UPI00265FAE64|nr:hypothetical protein [uncultured Enorma sp.]
MYWTTYKLRYLEEHANEGAEAIAEALGCSRTAVEVQASRYGISLRKRWRCPRCGMVTFRPLSTVTGWCANCTKEARRDRIAEEVREMEEEVRRAERENRERQALYSKKHRMKKKLESMKSE